MLDREPHLAAKATRTGNPVRPLVLAAAATPYAAPDASGPLRLVAFGGSQGARIMSDIVPAAIERLEPHLQMRLAIVQQAREEDVARVREIYARVKVAAEVAPFFTDLPARIAAGHLVISRSGASTVAELAAIGRPGHPGAAAARARSGPGRQCGACWSGPAARICLRQDDFTPGPARGRDHRACHRRRKNS